MTTKLDENYSPWGGPDSNFSNAELRLKKCAIYFIKNTATHVTDSDMSNYNSYLNTYIRGKVKETTTYQVDFDYAENGLIWRVYIYVAS